MSTVVYQASDLSQKRRAFIDAARAGQAHLRDTDGTALVMLREEHLGILEDLATWAGRFALLVACARKPADARTIADYGDLTWLRTFDDDDLGTFLEELEALLVVSSAEHTTRLLDEAVAQWRTTAEQLDDPLRRSILLGVNDADDVVEVPRPG